jgi:hypothetical protein
MHRMQLHHLNRKGFDRSIRNSSKEGGTMLAPEFILFVTLYVAVVTWTILKILVNHLIDSEPPPIKIEGAADMNEDHHHRAA